MNEVLRPEAEKSDILELQNPHRGLFTPERFEAIREAAIEFGLRTKQVVEEGEMYSLRAGIPPVLDGVRAKDKDPELKDQTVVSGLVFGEINFFPDSIRDDFWRRVDEIQGISEQ